MAIQLELSLEEVNGVMVALGNLPYAQVEALITKIRAQVIPQVQAESEATKAEPIEDVYV
jgi:hypothetical protein